MQPVVRQCAIFSRIFYGQASDIGKAPDQSLSESSARQASATLTAIDNAVQDIVLSVVLQHFPHIRCIAEENTPLKRRFSGNESDYALILDPIDGTLHYQKGDAPYHISLGLAVRGRMEAAIVARPTENKLFTAMRGQGAYLQRGSGRPRRLRLPRRAANNRAFISSKARVYQSLARPTLEPIEYPIGAALVLTLLAEGELCAYLTRQVEVYDVGPPSLIAEEAGVLCALANGQKPRFDRRRKFAHFLAASSEDTRDFLFAVLRRGRSKRR